MTSMALCTAAMPSKALAQQQMPPSCLVLYVVTARFPKYVVVATMGTFLKHNLSSLNAQTFSLVHII